MSKEPTSAIPPRWPEDQLSHSVPDTPPPKNGISAVSGNRAALTLLIMQSAVAGLLMTMKVPLGTSLLLSFVVNLILALTVFRSSMQALFKDTRWTTKPNIWLTLGIFILGFFTSRMFMTAFVVISPDAANSTPQFNSTGLDFWALLLAAGILIPIAEEVAFRGLMLRGHERVAGFGIATTTTTVAFALAHGAPTSIVGILPLGYVLARLTQHTGSLWGAVIIHILHNSIAIGLGALLLGGNMPETNQATELLQTGNLKYIVAGIALSMGIAGIIVINAILPTKADPQVPQQNTHRPWLSGAYIGILAFGILNFLFALPVIRQFVVDLRNLVPN